VAQTGTEAEFLGDMCRRLFDTTKNTSVSLGKTIIGASTSEFVKAISAIGKATGNIARSAL